MRHTAIAAALTVGFLLTSCAGSDHDGATTSASPKATATHTTTELATPSQESAEDAVEKAKEDFEQSLKDLDDALGETLGVQEGTYSVTNSQPDYEDLAEALDDEYIAPGTYTTKGPVDPAYDCYWARMGDATGDSILANDLTSGRAIVTLKEGEFFKTSGCKPWTRSGN
ncbi:hypothetical protein [Streptomyces antibioticus]|uniref:hypothetical protein n=1 Tax=Streptomyces antibioticus TaxID=1890 RepID=UPI0036D91FCE